MRSKPDDTPGRPILPLVLTPAMWRCSACALAFVAALLTAGGWLTGCMVMSARTMAEADPLMPFPVLAARAEEFEGRVVILGGYDYLTLVSREIFLWEREDNLPGPSYDRPRPYYDIRYRRLYDRRY